MKNTIATLALAAGAALGAAPASAAITLVFTPTATHIDVGQSVTVTATIGGLGAEVLSGFDLNFLYDAAVLQALGVSYPGESALGNQVTPNTVFTAGDLGIDALSLEDDATLALNQPNSFDLFTFRFAGIANGTSNFTLGTDLDFQRAFSGLNSSPLVVDVGNICISVGTGTCSVPEPSSYGLAGLALAGALLPAALRRRRKL